MALSREELIMANEKQALVDELKALLEQDVTAIKEQVDDLKTKFYRLYHEEQSALKAKAEETAEAAGEAIEWQPAMDELEVQFQELLNIYKQKRAEVAKKQAEEEEQNLLRKQNILSQMKELAEAEDAGDVMGDKLKKMRELQTEWKTIGAVPATKTQQIRKEYQQYQEKFYDLVKINIELKELDLKKNLEMKNLLIEAAEKLANQPNIVEANRALQQLHEEWAEIGPVARELREEVWERFKAASSVINKKHQAYFDALHEKEQENLQKKQALIERLQALNYENLKSAKKWDDMTAEVQTIQEEWRKIGFAPKKYNTAIYEQYRELCNNFFNAKTAFFKSVREVFGDNLKKKRNLLEQALELKDSEQWQETTDKLIALQKEWKEIGPVARKYSEELWKQFSEACDAFFERKREAQKEARAENRKARENTIIAGGDKGKLMRLYDSLEKEIKTAENNILFFTGKSNHANKLVEDMQRKIEKLKLQKQELEAKLNE